MAPDRHTVIADDTAVSFHQRIVVDADHRGPRGHKFLYRFGVTLAELYTDRISPVSPTSSAASSGCDFVGNSLKYVA